MTAMQPSLPPSTTEQEDITHAGQRRINLIWEYSQAIIAVLVVLANLIVSVAVAFGYAKEPPSGLQNTMFLIVGFYFSRTNHQAIGGVGRKRVQEQEYLGR